MVLFGAVLVLSLGVRFWLASRQMSHVARHRDVVPAPFAASITPEAHRKAADYTIAKSRLGLLELAVGTLVLLGWTLFGGLDLLNRTVMALTGPGMWQQIALVACFALIGGIVDLPFSAWRTFVLEQRFGFNRTTPTLWLADIAKATLLGALIGLPILALVLWLMAAAGGLWWLWAWGAWMALNLLLLVIYPTLIAPLFNKFKPLEDETLKTRATALMQRCGFAAKGFFVMDGSRRSAHANAYFTGFGAAKRVVFYDTLLQRLSADEVDAVLAHELGHFKHGHIPKRLLTMAVIALLGFALLGWLSGAPWFYLGLGVTPDLLGPNDALALLLFTLALPPFTFFLTPLSAGMSRRDEFQADAFAVAQTGNAALPQALLKLYEDNAATLTPDPWFVRFYYSHPPASERLARMTGA
ncbi:M48 family metallopeptidase [Xylophilus sp. GOD-11R]|uniref:M48 family metallopeptidase n=1 Tax=Xylophilus sp. GOD-11R TaxID=3089814 RepID=UPI00298CFDAC|nr:M48 family metallopeptidase [Xylophilus sp. GOD-11R]WPB59483.1 M48 family metallopeptidase [Xylophilus sp. GOD-11R]